MYEDIFSWTLVLLQMICVIVVFAYLFTRSRFFAEILDGHPAIKTQILMVVIFGIISIYGTISGISFFGAIVNVRDLGPMAGGLVGGPFVGLGAGLIGAAYRATLGGPTVISCTLATVIAGILGGIIYLLNHRKFIGVAGAVAFAALMEGLHLLLALLIVTPREVAYQIVSSLLFPMIVANMAGMAVFAIIITNVQKERSMVAERDILLREMERKQTELNIAAEIQQSFLPDTLAEIPNFDIAAKNLMAKEVGGDFFDVIPLEVIPLKPGEAGIVIGDVSGKGIPAALFMALTRIVIRVNSQWHKSPADAIRDANTIITKDSKAGMFITLFYGMIDGEKRSLEYVNAGHNPPFLYRASDTSLTEIPATGIAVGLMEDAVYGSGKVQFGSGDILVLFTDGITEAMNASGEMYGEDRLKAAVLGSVRLPAQEIVDRILDEVSAFGGSTPQYDDISILVLKAV
ncbi:MAG: SpoIIE family protein phosphatase [Methanoregulaceae archaeon]